MHVSVPVFSKQYVENTSSSKNETISQVFSAQGNRAVLNATVRNINSVGGIGLELRLQGSYDGLAWEDAGANLDLTAFGNDSAGVGSSGGSFDYAWARVSVQMSATSGTPSAGILNANVVFSHQ